jgi:epoxyqueuosine reductase
MTSPNPRWPAMSADPWMGSPQLTSAADRMNGLTALVKRRARELGFNHVGIAGVEPFAEGPIVVQRIEQGLLADMDWFTIERARFAADVRNLLPDARSVIAVAMSYFVSDEPPPDDDLRGHVARYARGTDYHDVMKSRLRELEAYLRSLVPEADAAGCVDTGRVIDRAIARRAGIGWYGKNTCVLARETGSWILLGSLISTVALVPDQPVKTNCGACTRCMTACPTGALIAPGVLDSRRCISYLTIELRGPIPRDLRPLVGTWIFGCDICQDVCPVNRHALDATEPAFRDSLVEPFLQLLPLLKLDAGEFRRRFAKTAIVRVKRDGFVRNVAVALGNLADARAIPTLCRAIRDDSPLVRGHVAWALGQIGGAQARRALLQAKIVEGDSWVCEEIDAALTR